GEMARTLLKNRYHVTGYDPDLSAGKQLDDAGGHAMQSVAEVLTTTDILVVSLSTTAALDATVSSILDAIQQSAPKPIIVVETSTLPLGDKARAMETLDSVGITMLDCPISGTAARMKERAWTIFRSGSKTAIEPVQPLLRTFTDNVPNV